MISTSLVLEGVAGRREGHKATFGLVPSMCSHFVGL